MNSVYGKYLISDEINLLQPDAIYNLLNKTYWAETRTKETVLKSIENSFCFGIYNDDKQVGFARCVTDFAVMYYLADVIVDEEIRGQGLGKALMEFIVGHEKFSSLLGVLETRDAHELYEQFGFRTSQGFAMRRDPKEV